MKKFYFLLVLFIGISVASFGQVYLEESFGDAQMPPDGWSISDFEEQWSTNNSNLAGGTAPEARFATINATGTSRLISPEIDLTGASTAMFSFKHRLMDNNSNAYTIGVATRSGGGSWTVEWETSPTANIGPEEKLLAFDGGNVGANDFQFCFFITGNLNHLNYWFLDDIKLFIPEENNAAMIEITMENRFYNATEVKGIIKNTGPNHITELEIKWQVPGNEINTSTITGISVAPANLYEFTCDDLFFFPPGEYDVEVWVEKVNAVEDPTPDDNLASKNITVTDVSIYRMPFLEEFTSSTCGPCAGFNMGFAPWWEEHADEIAVLKYQMNWPGAGDPYYTSEGGVRRDYYGVSGVPDLFGNGGDVSTNVPSVEAWFEQASQLPGAIRIAASFTLDGTVASINANILPYQDFSELRLYVAVFEWLTTENVGTNGETEFENVMMKMVPDAGGTVVTLNEMEIYEFSQSVDLTGTHIEEWDDLGVVFFLQDYGTKEVHQSAYGIEDYVYSDDTRLSEIRVNNIPIQGFDPDVNAYTVELPEGVTGIVPVTATPMTGEPIITYEYPDAVPGTVTIHVLSESLTVSATYTVDLILYTSITESVDKAIGIYPNPTNGMLYLDGIEDAEVSVYSMSGEVMNSQRLVNGNVIDLSTLANGIYLVKIQKEDAVVIKKVSLNK